MSVIDASGERLAQARVLHAHAAELLDMTVLEPLERAFINRFQGGFPLCTRPFAAVAESLDCDEKRLLETTRRLLQRGLLSRFGPLFDAARLGGAVTLAALAAPEQQFEHVAKLVNALPAVAHNYRREHRLNMWFVVASDTPHEVTTTLSRIAVLTGLRVYDFPKEREFHVGLWLQLGEHGQVDTVPLPEAARPGSAVPELDELDRRLVRATQAGLPLVAEPYAEVAALLGLDQETVIARLQRMLDSAVVRRIGAVPQHYALGLHGNGMSVWDVDDDAVDELGARVSELDFVSHCYQRPRHGRTWPYNLFAMAHGRDRSAVLDKTARITELLGARCHAHDVLFSSRVLKKTGLRLNT